MLGIDSEIGISALRLWVAAGSAALLVVLCALALFRPLSNVAVGAAQRAVFIMGGAALGAAMTWAFLDRADWDNHNAERQALELRAQELNARTLSPGSPLACLDALVGENVEAACEKALFISAASVASASSYVAARLALLSSLVAYAGRDGADIENVLSPLRRSLEVDRFGFVAHLLATRDSCTSHDCKALALLGDASRVRANMEARTLDQYLEHYAALWTAAPEGTVADGTQSLPSAATSSNTQGPRKMINIDFPTAASIPAVSIMNPEPAGPVLPGVAAAAAANPNPQPAASSSRRTRKQTGNSSAPAAVQSASSNSSTPEPIWPEPVPPPPSPQTAAAPAGTAPLQLNSPSAAPANPPARAQ